MDRFGGCFARRDLRRQAEGYVRGPLGSVGRKNGWQLAEHLGREKPYGIQRLLGRANWRADDVRDELVRYAADHLVTDSDPGVLVVDQTGFLKGLQVGRSAPAVLGHRRTDRKQPDRRVSGPIHRPRPGPDRPGVVPAAGVV
ncbi:MAG: transposase [Tepidisphaeraceae bacterium]